MTSKEVKKLLESDAGKTKLYFDHKKYFDLVDSLNTKFAEGGLFNEYELSDTMEKLTGCYGKFVIIGNAVDAYKTNRELDYIAKAFADATGKPNVSQIKELARSSVQQLREIRGDFLNYSEASQKGIGTCQSRLKRLTVEKGAKKIDYTGATPVGEISQAGTVPSTAGSETEPEWE